MDALIALVERWKADATILEAYGANQAVVARKYATELEAGILEWQLEALTLSAAERESGYSYSTLQQMVADGEVPNAGEKNKPRIRRCDMPKKAGRRSLELMRSEPDLVDMVLAAGN
jgi:hypothetical protein